MRIKSVFIGVGSACLILLMSSLIFAFRVQPARLDMTLKRGQTGIIHIALSGSKGTRGEYLKIYPVDLIINRNGSLAFERQEHFKYSVVPWISLREERVRLFEGRTKDYELRITVPRSAVPGEYYAIVMFEPTEPVLMKDPERPIMVKMISRIAVPIILNVPGRIYKKQGKALETGAQQIDDGKVEVNSTFKNTGSIHLDVCGSALIKSKDKKRNFAKIQLKAFGSSKKSGEGFIMPGNLRDFKGISERPLSLPAGEYVAEVSYDYGYKFRKARDEAIFTITKQFKIDESKISLLLVDTPLIEFEAKAGVFKTLVVKVSNIDFQPLRVLAQSEEDWCRVSPSNFILKSGENRNLKIIISVPDDKKSKRQAKIIFKPDRGKETEVKLIVYEPGKMPKKEKKES